jgi:hypothetical protein
MKKVSLAWVEGYRENTFGSAEHQNAADFGKNAGRGVQGCCLSPKSIWTVFMGIESAVLPGSEIAHAPQQPVGNPRRPARARGEFERTLAVDSNCEQMG